MSGTLSQFHSRVSTPVPPLSPRAPSAVPSDATVVYAYSDQTGPFPEHTGPFSPDVVTTSEVPVYDHEKMGTCAAVLLHQFPLATVSDLVQHLCRSLQPTPPPAELVCLENVFRGVEIGQRLLADRLLRVIRTVDMSSPTACFDILTRIFAYLGDLRNRPVEKVQSPESDSSDLSFSESESEAESNNSNAPHYSDISQ